MTQKSDISKATKPAAKDNYKAAEDAMFAELKTKDPALVCKFCRCEKTADGYALPFYGRNIIVNVEKHISRYCDDGTLLTTHDNFLVLAYLLAANPKACVKHKLLAFRDIKDSAVFEAAYLRSIKQAKEFFVSAEQFRAAVEAAGFEFLSYKDVSVLVPAFELIPLTVIFHEGDDEFPSDLTVLFDESITEFIHPENVPGLGAKALNVLMQYAKK